MTKIVILAAGRGARMNSDLPKVLVPLKGRPMIKYLMDEVGRSGIDPRPVIIVSNSNKDAISTALDAYEAEYVVQDEPLGTGHAVSCAREAIDRCGDGVKNIVVLYGDHPFLKSESIKSFASIDSDALTIMPTLLPDFDDWRHNFYHWGRIIKSTNGKVEKIVEFKDANDREKEVTEVNPGFMCFDKNWLFENINKLSDNNNSKEYYLTDMVKIAFDSGLTVGTVNIDPHEAMGINSPEELQIAESLL